LGVEGFGFMPNLKPGRVRRRKGTPTHRPG
jgi:hypothetical protein